ncbi:FprA family A-type flavoprotein [Desulfovibrio desulfuricans]|uniref:FprA family A-type flavoprotein n=1 Tax=Desulfovibrio desulfuricans TaxID=876 RepID=UPI001D074175|nr:FprA family A-type flavoprotein [Desulfovibrio desulfuricans]MCB6541714.1 FprA family A-type flavoprotein [Desulfovibrio desulfuricans]MCB6552795.1 FprA family A-type flavoprotein [Desulfovibrio desulfuricans]MCB6564583.1 FprA family A-type flavoprotein [Desulfovibrio desulfuricans]MCB7345820.1 FprA family A-type flavoprotein [Desulfovibrio desulfuricans]MCQ4861609.1 FprA family A-type flavoprotein [Desulfovibrio desulfuricans]
MQPVEIKKDIFWVGFVDYDHRDFHGYSRSPDGSTYNAYLIKDEKNVLLDTVASGCEGTLLCRMAQVLEPEKIDYIICNHMELDHAGALEAIIERCKPEKIFVSQTGLKSMAGYFDCKDWPVQAVKSGDSINIGKRTIVFQETRMLHWPDSMVSYIPEDKLLVSNDIFGQNIASSARFVDEFGDDGEYTRRVKEYYFNIVLPYSPMVLKTLPVVEKLDIDMIAPDHGLIQRGEKAVRGIIDLYRAMAEQKPQQRALIFYDTMWESTETMAYAICSGLEENNVPTRIMSVKQNHHSAVMTELADCGAVIAGSPTHNNTVLPLMAAQLTYMKGLRPLNRIGGAFGSYGWSGEGPKFLHEQLASMNMEMPAEPVKCNWRPDHEALKACHQMGVTIAEALKKKCQG